MGWKNLEKTEYPDLRKQIQQCGSVEFALADFNINIWYQGLASDGFFLLSNGWRISCFTALKQSILKSTLLSQKEIFLDL